ncbi:hypothetical protein GC173_15400 [bacterium]|nr:hypothetical protein [bacterium]
MPRNEMFTEQQLQKAIQIAFLAGSRFQQAIINSEEVGLEILVVEIAEINKAFPQLEDKELLQPHGAAAHIITHIVRTPLEE